MLTTILDVLSLSTNMIASVYSPCHCLSVNQTGGADEADEAGHVSLDLEAAFEQFSAGTKQA